ncbi:hypothetical protein DN752_19545 [Echinicola strongylocentroti]|uniref:Single-stranded DNA-binding protein n=1 Tax=Echinicola strongylocentroti TaxID=1795355 RepID=A0A2Z4INN8_9BACT|nr:single-stranded DNA-binding protein [Echinicola strongylocentroti]AWW32156.1 hypothetical protein DN752_19545 [Echinicola strongylocentroti]
MDYRKLILSGNLVSDAEVKQSEKGNWTAFKIACNPTKEETVYYSIAINGDKLAEWLKKGKKVVVEGTPHVEAKQNKYNVTEIYHSVKNARVTMM